MDQDMDSRQYSSSQKAVHSRNFGSCCSSRANRVSYTEDYDSELDSDPDDAKKKSKANVAVALMDTTEEMDDEVERILSHR